MGVNDKRLSSASFHGILVIFFIVVDKLVHELKRDLDIFEE